ncbi:MAG: hypothetical protein R2940_07345 [Syntrophotaleaceae bacterium]
MSRPLLKSIFLIFLLGIFASFINGCQTHGNLGNMTPNITDPGARVINKSVRVVRGSGGINTRWPNWYENLSDADLEAALFAGLKNSGIFSAVTREGETDLDVSAIILSQRSVQDNSRLETRNTLKVGYIFVDRKSGKAIWRETIETEFGSRALLAHTRYREACEGGAHENLSAFIKALSENWPETL